MALIDKEETIQRAAETLFRGNPNWSTFYREIFGLNGVVRRQYPTLEALAAFEETAAYRSIQQMLRILRERRPPRPKDDEDEKKKKPSEEAPRADPTQVITVRIPRSLHRTLRIEAFEHHTSLNKLCVSKLLQFIDAEMVPGEAQEAAAEATEGNP